MDIDELKNEYKRAINDKIDLLEELEDIKNNDEWEIYFSFINFPIKNKILNINERNGKKYV